MAEIKTSSFADLMQLINVMGQGSARRQAAQDQRKSNFLNEAKLYESLLVKATNSEQVAKLKSGLDKLSIENNEFEGLNDLDDYLSNAYDTKLEVSQRSEDAYLNMNRRYQQNKNLTDDDIQERIMGNPVEGTEGMGVFELTNYRNKLLEEQEYVKQGMAAGIKFGKGLTGEFLSKQYETYLGQTEAAMKVLVENQDAFKNFESLTVAERQELAAVHENLIVSVYTGDKDATTRIINASKDIYTNQYNKASKEADAWRTVYQQYFQETGNESIDIDAELMAGLGKLFGEDFEASDLYGKIKDVGKLTKEQTQAHFMETSKEAETSNRMFKLYTGEYLAEDYSPQDTDEQFINKMMGITGDKDPNEESKKKKQHQTNKDNLVNVEVEEPEKGVGHNDFLIFKQLFKSKEGGMRMSKTINTIMEQQGISRERVIEIYREQEQKYAKETGWGEGQYNKRYDGTYEWVPHSQRGTTREDRQRLMHHPKKPDDVEIIVTKNIDDEAKKQEFAESRKYTLGLGNPKMVKDSEFVKEFSSDVTGQKFINSYFDNIMNEEFLENVKDNPQELQKIYDELLEFTDSISGRLGKLKKSPKIMKEHLKNLRLKIRKSARKYLDLIYPTLNEEEARKQGKKAYWLTSKGQTNKKFKDGYIKDLEEKLSSESFSKK